MRMKEDAMRNGQLKPAYNLQHGVDSEYVTWLSVSPRPTDTRTLIPFLKEMEAYIPFQYQEITADAGYESEENYLFLEGNGQLGYIKPQNYEISKTRKYRQDIGRMENMEYDEKEDCYYCKNGQVLSAQYERQERTASGYRRTVTIYQSKGCGGCPFKKNVLREPLPNSTGRSSESAVHIEKNERETAGGLRADHQRIWDAATDEPKYPGGRKLCKPKRGYGDQTVFVPWESQRNCLEYPAVDGI